MTEADRPGAAPAVRPIGEAELRLSGGAGKGLRQTLSGEVSSCEAAWCGGFAPVRGGFVRRFLAETPGIKRK